MSEADDVDRSRLPRPHSGDVLRLCPPVRDEWKRVVLRLPEDRFGGRRGRRSRPASTLTLQVSSRSGARSRVMSHMIANSPGDLPEPLLEEEHRSASRERHPADEAQRRAVRAHGGRARPLRRVLEDASLEGQKRDLAVQPLIGAQVRLSRPAGRGQIPASRRSSSRETPLRGARS